MRTDRERFWLAVNVCFGAVILATLGVARAAPGTEDGVHWAFREVARPVVPRGADERAVTPIDRFIVQRLTAAELQLSDAATKAELIRRASFDLLGLPPLPDEVDAIVADPAPDAYARLIDRLLASPRFGERWGRHWLDVVRFAQTNGYEYDEEKPEAWRYRDWVIAAFNADLPYDQFVRQQLAGDELDVTTDGSITATGFYRVGAWDKEPDDERKSEFDGLDDMLATTCNAFLGVTLQCARCHDHPSDPFPQRDYYAMLAHFRNVRPYTAKPDQLGGSIFAGLPSGGRTLGVREHGAEAPDTVVFPRGDPGTPGETVAPGLPGALHGGDYTHTIVKRPATSGRRRALADWIVDKRNPLTARVIVNRLWRHHFGRGLVETPNDFGKSGLPPSHPELLDWLAAELINGGFRLKRLHRLIATSAVYRQSSRDAPDMRAREPENRLFWRQNVRRLEAEAIRDAALAASGSLNYAMGGRGFFPEVAPEELAGSSAPGRGWRKSSESERHRRSVYLYAKRNLMPAFMEAFDCANPDLSIPARQETTVAPQALTLLNGGFMNRMSRAFAERLQRGAGDDRAARVRMAYRWALSRDPTAEETGIAVSYLGRQQRAFAAAPEMIRLRPDLPPTMLKAFRERQSPADYYIGPRQNWSYHWGESFIGMAELYTVRPRRGPFALWDHEVEGIGAIMANVQFDRQTELAAILFRAQPKGDVFHGYEVRFEPRARSVALVRHAEELRVLARSDFPFADEWRPIRIDWTEQRLRVWSAADDVLLIDATDPEPLSIRGRVGLRCWGGEFRLNGLRCKTAEETLSISGDPDHRTPEDKALAAFANLVFNLNEFVYID